MVASILMKERRGAERYKTRLAAKWEGVLTRRDGTVADISLTGCFLLTPDDVQPKELVRLEIETPSGQRLYLWGEVIYTVPEMGFGVRFTAADPSEQATLQSLINYLREKKESMPSHNFYGRPWREII